jgi:hypothetical protein
MGSKGYTNVSKTKSPENIAPTFKRGMKKKAASPHNQVSQEGDQEDLLVPLTPAIQNTFDAQPQKQDVRQGIDDFGRVDGGVIVLR